MHFINSLFLRDYIREVYKILVKLCNYLNVIKLQSSKVYNILKMVNKLNPKFCITIVQYNKQYCHTCYDV